MMNVRKPTTAAIGSRAEAQQVDIALAHPVFDPQRQICPKFFWMPERLISAIGME
jgi:hypothetical protein